jgi:hypothetical protein
MLTPCYVISEGHSQKAHVQDQLIIQNVVVEYISSYSYTPNCYLQTLYVLCDFSLLADVEVRIFKQDDRSVACLALNSE